MAELKSYGIVKVLTDNPVVTVVASVVIWYAVSSFLSWYRLRHVPGPWLASFSYLWVAKMVFFGRGQDYAHLTKYGSVVRTGPNYIVSDDPDVLRLVNSARSTATRDPWYLGAKIDPETDTLISEINIKPHDAFKAKASFAYSGRDGNMNFEVGVNDTIAHFKEVIRARFLSEPGQLKPMDFAHFIRYFTLDIITLLGYGKRLGFMDYDGDLYGYTKNVENLLGWIATAGDVPLLRQIFFSPLSAKLFAPRPTDSHGLGKVMGIGAALVDERFKDKDTDHHDMIGSLIRHGCTLKEIKVELFTQITAGSDTSATAMRTTLMHLIGCPRAYSRLKAEIKQAIVSGAASNPITNDEAKALPYLQAVIWEGLRMRPPLVYGFYKKLHKDETINGYFLPSGTSVGWNAPAMMRLQSVFGNDAEIFRPERYLECDKEKATEMMRTVELVFGYGRWMCAGKVLAFMELNKIFFELLRDFDFQLISPGRGWKEVAYTAVVQWDMQVAITECDILRDY
ncbi:cytochrome P450 [Xylariales sp. PMI_506]|nr:cytochrome P450 [Xylariales sp. PMI_506]